MIPSDFADNALYLGTALHTGIEQGAEKAIQDYYNTFPVISDAHVTEAIKLEIQIEKAQSILPPGEHEVPVFTKHFKGFIDLLVPVGTKRVWHGSGTINPSSYGDGDEMGYYTNDADEYDLYDFKYSNNVNHYMDSRQLHLYKYYFEIANPGKRIRNLFFVFVPKNGSKQKEGESLYQFRERLIREITPTEIKIVPVPYDAGKVIEHLELIQDVQSETEYEASSGWLCRYCEYNDLCQKGNDYMVLPSTERRNIAKTTKRKIWIYGAAFSGKTTMLDEAPNPLNLNTDGNIQFVTMPFIPIKDEVKAEGRITKRKFAWEVFKDTITELEKGGNDFKTIIIDLLEDTREMCRVYMYDQLRIQHESDSGYGKGWDIIKTEYLSTMRRFFNLDYENLVVVSHEDVSKDITKKNGQNITRIAPNIQDAIANKVAGMVDIVARVVVEDDGSRTLNFKSNEVIFGGGRLKGVQQTTIPLSWSELMKVYEDANSGKSAPVPAQTAEKGKSIRSRRSKAEAEVEAPQTVESTPDDTPSTENLPADTGDAPEIPETNPATGEVIEETPSQPTRRIRKSRSSEQVKEGAEAEKPAESVSEPSEDNTTTTRRTRRKRA